jgi:hypothetical protein
MKNLINDVRNSDDFPLKPEMDKGWRSDRRNYRSEYHKVEGIWPWKRIKRICQANIGKPFDTAFSIYCSQVPQYQQPFFKDEFDPKFWRSELWTYFYLDKNNCIQKNIGTYKTNQKKAIFYSDDYRTGKVHKKTGVPLPDDSWWRKGINDDDYEIAIIKGYALEFNSRKEKEFKRLMGEQRKRRVIAIKERRKALNEKAYSFVSKSEEEKKKEKAKNKNKIERKGFDYETSFRNEKQTNPDTIKDKQGF